ncbi:granzyme B [Ornithorhynchus anatinus]|uniref:Granzyme n=1 Tax=Ornithorhynchus anatinus TaxID=9258 RepID=Q9GME0_ORNAN|nr:granzyme B [Ornithorhynchus anatinus]AAG00452.1 granzyme [Ornithorhynchus anatinus]
MFLLSLLFPLEQGWEIIGGREVKPHSRPYMAYLKYYKNGKVHECGGFLVRKDFVLTAAHCRGSKMGVLLGAHSIAYREATQQRIPVAEKFSHDYNNRTHVNDIMLLKLAHTANMTKEVNVIRLPLPVTNVKPGTTCSVAGWGMMGANGPKTSTLQEVQLEVMPPAQCSFYRSFQPSCQLCVGNPNRISPPTRGDSGGPMVCGKQAQGIVSYGRWAGKPPNVYTRISFYLPWIKEILQKN